MRPSCDQILKMNVVKNRILLLPKEHQESIENEESPETMNLLGTIKVPRNLSQLSKTLPKPNYDGSRTYGPRKTKPELLDLEAEEKAHGAAS
jgi:hypothetical protein